MTRQVVIGLDLSGAGEHPGAWRVSRDHPSGLLDGTTQLAATQRAEAAGVDFATFGDSFSALPDDPHRVSTQLDAVALAARIAPDTSRIGLVPTVTTTHTEPFHVQAEIATLDHVSQGRAGWLVDVSTTPEAAAVIGRRGVAQPDELWQEAADVVVASRELWDSWEDDAIIRDASTGRFIDRARLHDVGHEGPTFSVKGPSIVPRPPQGHPVTVVTVASESTQAAAARADVVLVPVDVADLPHTVNRVRQAVAAAGRDAAEVLVLVSASVLLAPDVTAAKERASELAAVAAGLHPIDHVGTVAGLTARIESWLGLGVDGVHLRPAVVDADLGPLLDHVVPALRPSGSPAGPPDGAPDPGSPTTLRDRLGLERPVNQYATVAG